MNATPLKGRTPAREAGEKTGCSHVCQRWIYKRNKETAAGLFFPKGCMQAGSAGGVFSLRNTGLMQNKRASLNIEKETVQQHLAPVSVWHILSFSNPLSFTPFILTPFPMHFLL